MSSFKDTFFVDEELDRAIASLTVRYQLRRKATAFDLALHFLLSLEEVGNGFILGYADDATFYRFPFEEFTEEVIRRETKRRAMIPYTLLFEDGAEAKVERLRVKFGFKRNDQVYSLAILFLKDVTTKEDEGISFGTYDTDRKIFRAFIRTRDANAAKQEVKELLDRIMRKTP